MARYRIKVVPRSSKNQVIRLDSGVLKVKLMALPVEGRANRALLQVLADHFGVKKSSIRLVAGETSSHKWVEIL